MQPTNRIVEQIAKEIERRADERLKACDLRRPGSCEEADIEVRALRAMARDLRTNGMPEGGEDSEADDENAGDSEDK